MNSSDSPSARTEQLIGIFVFFAALLLYWFTLAPDVLTADNGEFQLIAAQLGVAHPPGYPLYTLIAHLFTRLPLSPAVAVNLFSAISSSLTLTLVFLCAQRLSGSLLGSTTAVFALATATTFWAQATTANIRSLTAFFATLTLYWLTCFYQEINHKEHKEHKGGHSRQNNLRDLRALRGENSQSRADRYLFLTAVSLSFGLTHHLSLLFMAFIFFIFVLWTDPRLLRQGRRWLRPFLGGLLGLFPLLYLPLRAGSGVRGSTDGLATLNGFLNHALALGFRGDTFYFITPELLAERLRIMGNVLTFQFSGWLLLGMGIGLAYLLWENQKIAFLLGGSFLLHLFITATYRAPQTVEYMLPAYVPAVLCLAFGISRIFSTGAQSHIEKELNTEKQRDKETKGNKRNNSSLFLCFSVSLRFIFPLLITATFLLAALWQGWRNYPSFAYLHQSQDARDFAQPILDNAPPNSIILAHWHWATPLWYLTEVEALRPDLTIEFVAPGAEEYSQTWANRVREELANGRSVVTTHFDEATYAPLPPPLPIGEAFLFSQEATTTLTSAFTPLDQPLNQQITLIGYSLHESTNQPINQSPINQELIFTLAWQPTDPTLLIQPLFAHLVNDAGQLIGQNDLQIRPRADGLTLTQFRITPVAGTLPGEATLFIGSSGEDRTPLTTVSLTPMTHPPITQNPTRRFTDGRTLIGYDWDNTLPVSRLYLHWKIEDGYVTEVQDGVTGETAVLPPTRNRLGIESQWQPFASTGSDHYIPLGQGLVWLGNPLPNQLITQSPIRLPQTFAAQQPVQRDLALSVRLIGYQPDSDLWAWWHLHDTIPAMGSIPTLKWIATSQVTSPNVILPTPPTEDPIRGAPWLIVSPEATDGQRLGATLRLYDAFNNRPIPILDNRITAVYSWIPLGDAFFDSRE